jgi:hypothetical protein
MDPEGAIDPAKKETAAIAVMSLAIGLLLQGVVEPRATDWGAAGRESIQMLLEGMTRRSS